MAFRQQLQSTNICYRMREMLMSDLYNDMEAECNESAAATIVTLTHHLYLLSQVHLISDNCTDCKT